jgi:hypothetical protein|nr:MAG TPA_asm: protein of unknown function DUF4917 [Bacteriophage sp.]
MKVERIKELIQSCNVNFLIGSGLSRPYLNTLGDIENWLTELNKEDNSPQKEIIRASIYAKYFTDVIKPNLQSEIDDDIVGYSDDVLGYYRQFLILWNDIIVRRASRLHNKQINIFSTNIDLFVERAAEKTGIEFNDGFKGRINPIFDEGNFQKSYTKTSTHYQNVSEIPVFNLLKLHGSIDWKAIGTDTKQVSHDSLLENVQETDKALEPIQKNVLIEIDQKDTLAEMVSKASTLSKINKKAIKPFTDSYEKLVVINPTKQKFKDTVLDLHFYELMRIYSNVLEKENSLLFVMGFSFADEHIAKITMRVADSNPTLLIIIFSFSDGEKTKFEEYLKLNNGKSKNNNILIITPSNFIETNAEGDKDKLAKLKKNVVNFDFKTLNAEVFEQVSRMIPINNNNGK